MTDQVSFGGIDLDDSNEVLRQAVKSYKDAMRPPKKDLDVEFFLKTMNAVNESSPLKVARNPIGKDGGWRHETPLRNVRKFELDDEGRLTVYTRNDHEELSVDKALDLLGKMKRRLQKEGSVMLAVSDSKRVQITDIYSHAFVQDSWAGLPFDLVLGYFEPEDDE